MKIVSSIVVALVSLSVAHLATLGRAHAQTPCSNPPEFETIGGGVAGITGKPILVSNGEPVAGQAYSLRVTNAAVNTVGLLVFGPELAPTPFPDFGATVYPSLATGTLSHMVIGPTGESGSLLPIDPIPFEVCGLDLYLQALVVDTSLPTLAAFTDAVHLRVGSLQPPSSSGQIPPPPVPNPVPSITGATLVTVSGTAAQAANVKIEAPTSTQVVPVSGGVFSAVVTLQTNKLNTITLQSLSVDNVTSPIVTLGVTQDSQPPALYIDFPENRTVLTTTTTDVAGRVSDLLSGFLGLTVTVNGQLAVVDVGIGTNGTFVAQGVVLDTQASTPIVVVAQDQFGNSATKQISLTYTPATGDQMAVESGNGQRGAVNTELGAPIVLKMTKANGAPFANKVVKFEITKNNGTLSALSGGAKSTELQVYTDAQGLATAWWTLGGSAGCGNNRVAVTSKDISGTVFFCASATAGPAAQINVGSGNNQRVELLGQAPLPLRAWVNDSCNGIAGIPVTFTVTQGNGKVNGQTSAIVLTSTTGHAEVAFTVGSTPGNNVVEADFATSLFTPAVFTTVGVERDPLAPTTFRGLVLDNARQPIEGALCTLEVGSFEASTTSGPDGVFLIEGILAVGAGHLHVAGATATAVGGRAIPPGSFPSLGYMTTVIANAENSIGMPVLLPALDPANEVWFDNTHDVELTCQGIAGLKMLVKAGSMTLVNGTVPSLANPAKLSLNQVHHDDIPMPMPDGAAPPFSWTLQPGGAKFNPPIQITYPNMSGLPPSAVAYFLSFDHDTERFEIVSSGTVSEDGSVITTDPGSGLDKAGWGCNCPPYSVTGDCCKNEPESNGCGSGWNEPLVPDCFPPLPPQWITCLGKASFSNGSTDACDKHDFCWGTCQGGSSTGQQSCDQAFLQNLKGACSQAFGVLNPCYYQCQVAAYVYYLVVSAASGTYQSSQDEACKCPPSLFAFLPPPAALEPPPYPDLDGDFLDDTWEAQYGVDTGTSDNALLDPDFDGLNNILEMAYGTDPTLADTDGNGASDTEDIEAQVHPPVSLDETWTVQVNGQLVTPGPNGTFKLTNVSAPDLYGPGGPGSAPDFKSDDFYRLTGQGKYDDSTYYVFSDYFQIIQGQSISPGRLTFTPIAPVAPASLVVQVNPPSSGVLTTLGETATTSVTALLPDGSLQDVSGSLSWSTYNSSNLKVASVSKEGVVTATGDGIAYITAKNDGATAVTAVIVAVGDPLTRVEGFVQQSDGTPVSGAQISVPLISSTVTTDSTGFFSLQGVPSDLGPITVYATAEVSGETLVGSVSGLEPEAGGITDAGVIVVQNTVQWAVDASGSWHVGSNWNTGQVPTANDHVVIDRPLGTFTITVSQGSQFAKSLTCKENLTVSGGALAVTTAAQIDGTTILSGGTTTAGSLTVNGPFTLSGGTIAGTIVNPGFGGSGITSSGSLSKLNACTLNATLNAANGSTVTVQNGIVLNGTVNLNSSGSTTALDFSGTQTLLGTGSVVFAGTSANNFVRPTSGVLTIGPQFTIRGGHGTVGSPALGWINLGTIHADTASRTITLAGTAWKNQSQLKASTSGILSMTGTWANSGNLVVTSATVNLGGTFSLSDLGIFQNDSGTVNLTGTLQNSGTTLALNGKTGSWNLNGGTIQGGTLSQSGGAVLSFASNGNNRLDGVLVQGDLVMSQASGIVRINNGLNVTGKVRLIGTNTSLAFEGSESISAQEIVFEGASLSNRFIEMQAPGTLTIPAGLLVHGGRGVFGSGYFGAAMTLVNQGEIRAEVSGNAIYIYTNVASFNNQGQVNAQGGGQILISAASFNNQGQVNAQGGGLILIDSTSFTNAGTMALQGSATHTISSATWSNTGSITEDAATLWLFGNWTNPGTLTANGGTVNLGGTFTTGQLATFVNNGGAVNVTGTMNNTGARLVLSGATGSWTLNGGTILGGSLDQQGGALLGFAPNGNNRLDGVLVQGDLAMSQASGIVRINNSLNVTGKVRLIGANTSLAFEGSESISAQEVVFEGASASNRYIEMYAPGTLTIPVGLLVHGGRGTMGGSGSFGAAMTLVNQGEIRAEVSANPITISAASFNSQGQVNAQGGGVITINSTSFTNAGTMALQGSATHTISSATWSNTGSITEDAATLTLSGSWTNPGTLTANGGTVNLGGAFTTGQLATFVNNGGAVNVTGTMNNAGARLVLSGATGSWTLSGGAILGGSLDQQGGALLGFAPNGNNRLDGVLVQGDLVMSQASGIVRINNGLNVTGKVRLIGTNTSLAFEGSESISAQEVVFEGTSASNRYIEMQSPGTLTIPAGLLLHGGRGIIGGSLQFGQAMTLVNQGEIRADVSANPITISAASFSNQGQLNAQGGGTVTLNSTSFTNSGAVSYQGGATHTISSANWSNSGSITEASATLSLSGSWTNPGSITANGGTINLGGTFTTGQLATFVNNGGVVNVTGTLNNAGATLVLNGATGSWTLNGGSILGGTLDQQGGALLGFASNTGNRLDGVQVQGDLVMSQASGIVRINNGLNVTGMVRLIGASTSLAFEGSETVSAQEVVFEGTSASNRYIEMQAPGTLTIPAGLLLHGGRGIIGGSLQFGQAMTLVNQGEIRADVSANPITISAASFSNQGQLNAQGGGTVTLNSTSFTNSGAVSYQGGATHTISSANWSNSGSITEASATLSLSGSWTNPGSITANGGTINLGGTFTTGQLATFVNNGGVVNVTGTLNNAGATLVLNGATGSWTLNGGSILGGTLDQQGGALLGFASNTGNRLDGVQVQGDLVMSQASGIVRINNGLNVTGMVRLIGASTSLAFEGSETISAQEVVFEGTSASNRYIEMQSPGTLTIPAGLLLHGGRGIIGGSLQFGQAMTLVNQGEIRADVSANPITISAASFSNQGQLNAQGGGTVTLNSTSFTNSGAVSYQGGATHTISSANWSNSGSITEASATLSLSGSWTNPGSITANGGTINLGGTFTTGQLATFVNNGGVVNVTGTLNNAGATLVLNGATGSWTLNGGSILGGTLDQQGGALLGFASNTGNRLDGVQVQGDLVMSQASGIVRINNGLNVTGMVRLIGASTSLAFEGSETISAQEVVFEGTSASNRYIEMQSPGTLTIPAGLLLHGGRGIIGGSLQFGQAMTLVNQGEIRADVSANPITISAASFSNQGQLNAQGGGTVTLNSTSFTNSGAVSYQGGATHTISSANWSNSGSITEASATLSLSGSWTNPGSITANGGTINLGGTFTTGQLATFVNNGGVVNVTGTLNNAGATLVLNGATGSWTLNGGSILGGTLDQQGGALLGFASNTGNRLDGVQVQGDLVMSQASGIVRINNGLNVTGKVRIIGTNTSLAFEGSEPISVQEIVFEGASGSNRYIEMQSPGTLTIPAGLLVHGGRGTIGGSFQFGQAMTLVNQGEIRADVSGNTLTLAPSTWSNPGTLAAGPGVLSVNGNGSTSGLVTVVAPGSLSAGASSFTQTGSGQIELTGATLTANGGIQIQGGTLMGTGTLVGAVTNSGAISPGASAGALNVTGSYTQTGAGSLNVELGGTATSLFDRLVATGLISLDGTLNLSLIGAYVPTLGDSYAVANGSSLAGQFASVTGTAIGSGLALGVGYAAQSATVAVVPSP